MRAFYVLLYQSLPSRERGLKFNGYGNLSDTQKVAPFTGAWIEIFVVITVYIIEQVAPFTGAWIEMSDFDKRQMSQLVAPFTGAWIEISGLVALLKPSKSLPSRERGLKLFRCPVEQAGRASLPSRERGLKCNHR